MRWSLFFSSLFAVSLGQEDEYSTECKNALAACESDLECGNRLAPLMAACTTGTCQPQCRMAVLNVYQNRLGRALLRSDASCLPGRDELKTCNFLPLGATVHCSLVKLSCEADLECNSAWEAFVSECEAESKKGSCPARCSSLLSAVTSSHNGAAFASCSCTDKDDQLCEHLKDNVIGTCTKPSIPSSSSIPNSITEVPSSRSQPEMPQDVSSSSFLSFTIPTVLLFLHRVL
ncbi:phg-1 [Pristionchus pacificus]|uniref:Phg-1 n=1 Tax=Pristionchus pacificus TaxID=54126 RepID=A0A2A6B946_PRIPA|nr:phg-1 [Pristionchus pacificus]|eukprot:PDM62412.1 phg-1 [Pristionchus pacificus]